MTLSTKTILAYRALNRPFDQAWVDWAAAMLAQGHDGQHLRVLAGEAAPFNQLEMRELVDAALAELGLR